MNDLNKTNVQKLFSFIERSQWQHITPSYVKYVEDEAVRLENTLRERGEQFECSNLNQLVDLAKNGNFLEAKKVLEDARREHRHMMECLHHKDKNRWQRYTNRPPPNESRPPANETEKDHIGSKQGSRDNSLSPRRGSMTDRHGHPQDSDRSPRQYAAGGDPYANNRPPSHHSYRETVPPPGSPQRRVDDRDIRSPNKDAFRPTRQAPSPRHEDFRSPRQGVSPPRDSYRENDQGRESYRSQDGHYPGRSGRHEDHHHPNSYHQNNDPRDRGHPPARNHNTYDMPAQHPGAESEIWREVATDAEKGIRSSYKDDYPPRDVEQDQPAYYGRKVNRELFSSGKGMLDRGRRPNEHDISEIDPITHRNAHDPARQNSVKPNDLARRFEELYQKQWSTALNEMSPRFGAERAIRQLLWIVTECQRIAGEIADHQMKDLEKTAHGVMSNPDVSRQYAAPYSPQSAGDTEARAKESLVKFRKQSAPLSVPYVKGECVEKIRAELWKYSTLPERYMGEKYFLDYVEAAAELAWYLRVQDPPIVMDWIRKNEEGSRFDPDRYRPYFDKKGERYEYCVWPMLKNERTGQIISRGIAQSIGK